MGAEQINLLYIIDMAEIPAHQERTLIDTNADKEISPAEQDAYLADQVAVLQDKLALTLGGVSTTLVLQESTLEFPPGQANLPTLRLIAHFVAVLPAPDGDWQINYRDTNYQERIGWSEVVVRATIGARVLESSVSDQDVSQELRTYPTDLLQSPLAVNAATVRFTTQADGKLNLSPANQTGSGAVVNTSTAPLRSNDRFAELITLPSLGPWSFLLTALALGGALLVTGPLRAAWVCTTNDSHWAALLPALLSLTLLLALLSFFTAYANPFTELLAAQAARPLDRQEIMANQALGITGILLQTGLMMGLLLLAVHRWSLKFGSLTLVLIISTALTVSTHTDFQLLPFVLGAGLIADTLYWLLKPSVTNLDGLRLFAFVTPAIFYALYFAALVFTGGIWWSIHIWSGTIVMAGIVGWLLSYAFAPPRTASE